MFPFSSATVSLFIVAITFPSSEFKIVNFPFCPNTFWICALLNFDVLYVDAIFSPFIVCSLSLTLASTSMLFKFTLITSLYVISLEIPAYNFPLYILVSFCSIFDVTIEFFSPFVTVISLPAVYTVDFLSYNEILESTADFSLFISTSLSYTYVTTKLSHPFFIHETFPLFNLFSNLISIFPV